MRGAGVLEERLPGQRRLDALRTGRQPEQCGGQRGGGKDDMAQGGGTDTAGVDAAFAAALGSIKASVGL